MPKQSTRVVGLIEIEFPTSERAVSNYLERILQAEVVAETMGLRCSRLVCGARIDRRRLSTEAIMVRADLEGLRAELNDEYQATICRLG